MKSILWHVVALAGLMEEANDGTAGSSGGGVGGIAEGDISQAELDAAAASDSKAPDVADTTGDKPGEPAGAHLDRAAQADTQPEPAAVTAEATADEYVDACKAGAPKIALVGKYSDRVPVQLKSQAHLDALRSEHGAASVEVQS